VAATRQARAAGCRRDMVRVARRVPMRNRLRASASWESAKRRAMTTALARPSSLASSRL